jgi:hypothetical protein
MRQRQSPPTLSGIKQIRALSGKRGRCTRRLTLYDYALAGGSDGTSTYRVAIIRLRHDDTQWQPATSWMLIAARQ